MSANGLSINLHINFPKILFLVVILHLFLILTKGLTDFDLVSNDPEPTAPPSALKIRRVKTAQMRHPHLLPSDSILNSDLNPADKRPPQKKITSLSDLSLTKPKILPQIQKQRPGTRPEVFPKVPREMNAISLKSQEFKDFSKSFSSGGLAISDVSSGAQKISDAVVSIEVPDGVNPDELNEYELMFYGFQKRTAMNYINSILKNLDKFQKTYPNYRLPTSARISMTARITYDSLGNVKQIKMVRWTHVNEMQNLFEDIVKGIDQLHNPPKALWQKEGEFSMFYTLEILNG